MNRLLIFSLLLLVAGCARQDTVTPACTEQPNDGRACLKIYNPVCGCNTKTYSNACEAESFGITTYTSGECGK
jgi:hypothetical protein